MGGMTEREVAESAERALSLDDDSARWDIVAKLQADPGHAAFDAAERLCGAGEAKQRLMGADILGQVGFTREGGARVGPFRDEAMRVLLDLVEREEDPEVLESVCTAFGHLNDPRAIGPLVRLRTHPDADIRFSVAFGLLALPEREALDALIQLSADPDVSVRDWATFGLGRQNEEDFPELREALVARIDDPDEQTRAEALYGLAVRGDRRALGPLLIWRENPWEESDYDLLEEALEALGEPRPWVSGGEQGGA